MEENFNAKEWKKLTAKELGLRTSMIAKPTRAVLRGLKEKGIVYFAFCFRFYGKEGIEDVVVIFMMSPFYMYQLLTKIRWMEISFSLDRSFYFMSIAFRGNL